MNSYTEDKMAEAEVSLRLAFYLINKRLTDGKVTVCIDGAQLKTLNQIHFDLSSFMKSNGWVKEVDTNEYKHPNWRSRIKISAEPGVGDVSTVLKDGRKFLAECKKGSLNKSKSSKEYPLLREAIGQIMTITMEIDNHILAVAVPFSEKFKELTDRWRKSPLILKAGILLLTINPDGEVYGFTEEMTKS